MKKLIRSLLVLSCALALHTQAHRAWIVPSSTVLSGEDSWVTFDAAVSNDLFSADHAPLRLNGVKVIGPNGEVELRNANTGKFRSTFDIHLSKEGTYKIVSASGGLTARWETEDGQRHFWPGRGETPNPAEFDKQVPQKAKNLQISQSSRRLETFVTAGAPGKDVFAPTNQGLEMVPITHPNDLFAGEKAQFQFLIDGEPAVGAKVDVIAGGMRYRNSQEALTLTTDKKGKVVISWPHAGMFWLNASYSDKKVKKPAQQRSGSYTATFEVFPE